MCISILGFFFLVDILVFYSSGALGINVTYIHTYPSIYLIDILHAYIFCYVPLLLS
jgi:hypothetical protein